jgi:hypothetical protein
MVIHLNQCLLTSHENSSDMEFIQLFIFSIVAWDDIYVALPRQNNKIYELFS